MMKAITISPPEANNKGFTRTIVELPIPDPKPGDILVEVSFAALNYIDLEASNGQHNVGIKKALKRYPVVSGIEMAGIARSDGEVIKQGDLVFGYTNIFSGPFYHAQWILTPEHNLSQIPDNSSLKDAVSRIGGALTTINAFERITQLKPDENILITEATGSIGVTAVQMASHVRARVTAVCQSTQVEFAAAQGAVETYAYDKNELPPAINQFDLVFDTAPSLSFSSAAPFLKRNGRYISTMPHLDIIGAIKSLFSRRKWEFLLEYDTDSKRMKRLSELISQGAFEPVIERVFSLQTALDAFNHQQTAGKRGKILIDFRSD